MCKRQGERERRRKRKKSTLNTCHLNLYKEWPSLTLYVMVLNAYKSPRKSYEPIFKRKRQHVNVGLNN